MATMTDTALEGLKMAVRGPVLRPGDGGYDEARTIYNGMFDRRPALIVRATGTADVIAGVNFARDNGLDLAVRGGGHNVAGNAVCEGGLMLDLSLMNGVFIDLQGKTVRAQGGATWGAVDHETQAHGLVAPGGVVSTTGIAGLTLNGGLGWSRNKYGLSCDNLISAEVVTAKGEVITASESENADLLWALRGGGGNFGVVTSFQFRLHPLGPMVAAAIPMYAVEDASAILRKWRDWVATTPDEVSTAALCWTVPVSPHMPPPVHGKSVLITAGLYSGPTEEGERVLRPLREFGQPLFDMSGVLPFTAMQSAFDPFFPPDGSVISYWKSVYADQLTDALIDVVAGIATDRASPMTLLNIPYFGGAVTRVRSADTAFSTRNKFMVSIDGNWYDKSENDSQIAWVRQAWDKVRPHSTGAVYLNFLGAEDQGTGDAMIRSAFGGNYDRLVQVKRKYDPANLFHINQNIKP
jgi:FAD/FMN-containing dehydrogenase